MSDQTSCHVPYDGGYCPQGLSFAERTAMLAEDPEGFRERVNISLRHHYEMICRFHERGTYFFDYGNSFLKAVYDAGEKSVCRNGENDLDGFVFPSYVEDILGPCLFDFGYGPFRWCCLSGKPEDLHKTDMAAAEYIFAHNRRYQDYDNYVWVRDAEANRLVVGTQCRILYQDAMGRMNIALKFNGIHPWITILPVPQLQVRMYLCRGRQGKHPCDKYEQESRHGDSFHFHSKLFN